MPRRTGSSRAPSSWWSRPRPGPLTVDSARWNKDILLLAFEEIETRNEAETLRGAKLFIETEELDEDDDEGWYEHELVGLEARVGSQVVGKVAALHTMPRPGPAGGRPPRTARKS